MSKRWEGKLSMLTDNEALDDAAIAALTLLRAGPVPRDGYGDNPPISYSTATLLIRRRLIEESHVTYTGMIATTRQRVYRITPAGIAALVAATRDDTVKSRGTNEDSAPRYAAGEANTA